VLDQVISSVIDDIPGTHPFIIGNACQKTGFCPGNDTHRNLEVVDFDYPTVSGLATQYGWEQGEEKIWLNDDPDNMVLDEGKINWEALWQFLVRLKSYCVSLPNGMMDRQKSQFIIHEKFMGLFEKKLSRPDWIELNGIVTLDAKRNKNHDKHMHLQINLK